MEDTLKSCFDFDQDSNSLAYATEDGLLRVWEPNTAKLKHEFLPGAHLSSSCTCLKWRARKTKTSKNKKSKGSGKPATENGSADDEVVAVGTATGNINLYSISRGEIQCQLKKLNSTEVSDVCWSHDSTTLFSGSSDGVVVEWDVNTAKHTRKWSSGKGGLTCLALCGDSHLISAGRSISLWNLSSQTEEKTFTGHATDIIQMHTILTDPESNNIQSLYIVSVAHDDRVISLWNPSSKVSKCKRAKASFILENEPTSSSVHYDRDLNLLRLAVLTTAGTVELFEYQLNGASSKKPIRPSCCLKVTLAAGTSLPVLASKLTESDKLLIMYGSPVCPGFDHVLLRGLHEPEIKLVREDPSRATTVTKVTAVGNVRQPKTDGKVTTLTPAVEGGKKLGTLKSKVGSKSEKRSLEEPEVTIEERLALLRGAAGGDKSVTGPVESLATLLAQALQSDDNKMLNKTLQTSDHKVITTTIRRLPPTCVLPLMTHLTARLEAYGSSTAPGGVVAHMSLVKWVRSLLHIHASYLATFSELMERLQRMYSIMDNRIGQLGTFTRLQGRLELMLSQVARQKDDDEGAGAAAALLTLQDESSEDEMMDDFDMMGANSESEDGYLSADEDDLVK